MPQSKSVAEQKRQLRKKLRALEYRQFLLQKTKFKDLTLKEQNKEILDCLKKLNQEVIQEFAKLVDPEDFAKFKKIIQKGKTTDTELEQLKKKWKKPNITPKERLDIIAKMGIKKAEQLLDCVEDKVEDFAANVRWFLFTVADCFSYMRDLFSERIKKEQLAESDLQNIETRIKVIEGAFKEISDQLVKSVGVVEQRIQTAQQMLKEEINTVQQAGRQMFSALRTVFAAGLFKRASFRLSSSSSSSVQNFLPQGPQHGRRSHGPSPGP